MSKERIFTIGCDKRTLKGFVNALQRKRINLLIDVRPSPNSNFHPEFNSEALKLILQEYYGIKYVYMPELTKTMKCNKPKNVIYQNLEKSKSFLEAIKYIEGGLEYGCNIIIMGNVVEYKNCCEYELIGKYLHSKGWTVAHLRSHYVQNNYKDE